MFDAKFPYNRVADLCTYVLFISYVKSEVIWNNI